MTFRTSFKTLGTALSVFSFIGLTSCAVGGFNAAHGNVAQEIADLRAGQARQTSYIQELQSELRRTYGRIEELEYTVGGQVEENRKSIAKMSMRLPPPPGVPADLLSEDMNIEDGWVNDYGLGFTDALVRLRKGEFDGARSILVEYVEVNRDSEYADNALFWTGVCFELGGKVNSAVLAYDDVYKHYRKGDRAVAALFYMARAYEKSSTPEISKLTLQKLLEEHPKTTYASLAQDKLN